MAQKATARKIETVSMISSAIELRRAGATYEQIGQQLDISKSRAHQLVIEGLEVVRDQIKAEGTVIMALELERLDNLLLGLWKQRQNPRVVDTILRVLERKHKLQGLDQPIKQSHELSLSVSPPSEFALWTEEDLIALNELIVKQQKTLSTPTLKDPEST